MKSLLIIIFLFLKYNSLLAQNVDNVDNSSDTVDASNGPPPQQGSHVDTSPTKTANERLINWLNIGSTLLKDKIGFSGSTINEALGIGNQAAQYAASIGSEIAKEGTGLAKQGLNKANTIGIKGIDQSAEIAKNVFKLLSKFPGLRLFTGLGNISVDLASKFGKDFLKSFIAMEHRKLDFLEKVAKNGLADTLASISQSGTGVGQKIVTNSVQAITGGIDTGMNALNTVVDKMNNLGQTISSSLPAVPNN